jgi:hypothetical protein
MPAFGGKAGHRFLRSKRRLLPNSNSMCSCRWCPGPVRGPAGKLMPVLQRRRLGLLRDRRLIFLDLRNCLRSQHAKGEIKFD